MSQDTSVEVEESQVEGSDDAEESGDDDFMSTEGMPKIGRRTDYASQIKDSAETFSEKAEEYKREDGSYSNNGLKLLFLADMKERGADLSLAQLARQHDKNSSTCKSWVHTYLKLGGIEALVAPLTRNSSGTRSTSATSKIGQDQIDKIIEYCNDNIVTSVEQVRDMLVEEFEFTSLGVAAVKSALDANDLHLGGRLYVAEGKAEKRTRKPKSADAEADGQELPPEDGEDSSED